MILQEAADLCRQGSDLSPEQIPALVEALLDRGVADAEKRDFLLALTQKGESAAELAGFAAAILPRAKDPGFHGEWEGQALFDCCGTGGGGLNIINISTALMFVLAGAGVPVVKHGNRGLTKTSGSADALEALGVCIDLPPPRLRACLEQSGMAFVFAPSYHISFQAIGPVRKTIAAEGKRTIFNLLGPLLNPVRPATQLTGVFRREHVALFTDSLARLGRKRFRVLYGENNEGQALGEASAWGSTLWHDQDGDAREDRRERPDLPGASHQSLLVRSSAESAARIVALLKNEDFTLARHMLLLNAAHSLCAHGSASSLEEGLQRAEESIVSGAALERLKLWQNF